MVTLEVDMVKRYLYVAQGILGIYAALTASRLLKLAYHASYVKFMGATGVMACIIAPIYWALTYRGELQRATICVIQTINVLKKLEFVLNAMLWLFWLSAAGVYTNHNRHGLLNDIQQVVQSLAEESSQCSTKQRDIIEWFFAGEICAWFACALMLWSTYLSYETGCCREDIRVYPASENRPQAGVAPAAFE